MQDTSVAANIRAELARRRVSARTAAAELGLTQSALSRRLRGHVDFSASEVQTIATFLGVAVSSLYGEGLSA